MSAKPKIGPVRNKNTRVSPRRYVENDAIDAGGEVVVRAGPIEGHENPDWLIGAN